MFTTAEIEEIIKKIAQGVNPLKIYLFGSYAKGTASIKSDLDLLIIQDTKLPLLKRITMIKPYISNYAIPINVIVHTPVEINHEKQEPYSFISAVFKSAREMYSK